MATVVIERLPKRDYLPACAALTADYGTPAWDARTEVSAIRTAVFSAMDRLDAETEIGKKLTGRKVLVKPNLVTVYDHFGTMPPVSPETTDPRVLDALILWMAPKASSIVIVESSGRGNPTRVAFGISGIDRLARHRGCGLVALEETPVDRYYLPDAGLQKEILVPRIFSEVVRGEAAYVSVPKLKTNLYTGVTLGFKNAMGVIPYNLRQRHHHYGIDRKLVEMLYLFKPDLVVIDGVVGGEGECPAPVDQVDSRMIIAGDHAVETDRVATRLMGFDPSDIELMRVADQLGFAARSDTRIIGDATPVRFRPADRTLFSDRVKTAFPGIRFFVGIDRVPPPVDASGPALAHAVEKACWGGCAATTRFALALIESEGYRPTREGVVIIGPGLTQKAPGSAAGTTSGTGKVWYDADGKPWTEDALFALPGKKMVVGSCGRNLARRADIFVEGCMPFANAPHMALHALTGTSCRVLSPANRHFGAVLKGTLAMRAARRAFIKQGIPLDVPFAVSAEPETPPPPRVPGASSGTALSAGQDKPGNAGTDATAAGSAESTGRPTWVSWPLPPLSASERSAALAFEDDAAAASLRGVFEERFVAKVLWKVQALLTFALTWAPLVLAGAGTGLDMTSLAGLAPSTWLNVWLAIEALHVAELPFAVAATQRTKKRTGTGRPLWQTAVLTLGLGYPAWIPLVKAD